MGDDKIDRILVAAEDLFLAAGLRGTTMEAIARAAGVAKPTLYGRFPDKEAVFRAVTGLVLARLRTAFLAELSTEGPARDRIGRALAAKFALIHHLLARSYHAEELLHDNMRLSPEAFAALSQWTVERIAEELDRDGVQDARARAELLVACADGVKRHAPTAEDLAERIRFVADRLLA